MRHTLHTRDKATGKMRPLPNTLTRRTYGQCPYCLHYGTDCHCHRRKTMPALRAFQIVYLVLEEEPETRTDFPCVVIGAYYLKPNAEARIAYERKIRGWQDDATYDEAPISWSIEEQRIFP